MVCSDKHNLWSSLQTLVAVLFFLVALISCSKGGDGAGNNEVHTSDTNGAVAFTVSWQHPAEETAFRLPLSPSGNVCVDYGIDTIAVNIYDVRGNVVRSKSWVCAERKGTLTQVPVGSGMWVRVDGRISSTAPWRGQSGTFSVSSDETVDAGTVLMNYIGGDEQPPEVDSTTPANESSGVPLNAEISVKFSEDVVAASVISGFAVVSDSTAISGSVAYEPATQTAIFTPQDQLSPSTRYTATIAATVEDRAGKQMGRAYSWAFTSITMDAPAVSTHPATHVTESAAVLNGLVNPNGLATTYRFEFGPDASYGSVTTDQSAGSGTTALEVNAPISGLVPNTSYHYRIVASNARGTVTGSDHMVTTDRVWAKTYGSPHGDNGLTGMIQQTTDGGYIVTGGTDGMGGGTHESPALWILKLDADGNKVWERTNIKSSLYAPSAVCQTASGGYVVTVGTDGHGGAGSKEFMVEKYESDGRYSWAYVYGGAEADSSEAIQQTPEGGFIVSGYTRSFGAGEMDVWVLKLTPTGVVVWQKAFGGPARDFSTDLDQTADGGYIISGNTDSFGKGDSDIWLLRLNAAGDIVWQKTYGGPEADECESVRQTADGGFIVCGETQSFGAGESDVWVLKLDGSGNVEWQKTYGGDNNDDGMSLQPIPGGGYVVAARTFSYAIPHADTWILGLEADGSLLWQKTYGGQYYEGPAHIEPTSDGGAIVLGGTDTFGMADEVESDMWIMKLSHNGVLGCGFGVDTSAVVLNSIAVGETSDATVTDTSAAAVSSGWLGAPPTSIVETQCP